MNMIEDALMALVGFPLVTLLFVAVGYPAGMVLSDPLVSPLAKYGVSLTLGFFIYVFLLRPAGW